MAANVLSQFKNTEVFSEFHSAIDKILDRVNISPDIQDKAIQQYVTNEYGITSELIAYGGDHVNKELLGDSDKAKYAFLNNKYEFNTSKNCSL